MDEKKFEREVPSYEDICMSIHRIHELEDRLAKLSQRAVAFEDRLAKLSQRVVALEKGAGRNY